jgi:nucleoside-diphosphate-sugar epimerase
VPENYWINRNVFVTGCTGLLGSWLVEELMPQQYLLSQKARQMPGWNPIFSVRDGFAEKIEWYKNYFSSQRW